MTGKQRWLWIGLGAGAVVLLCVLIPVLGFIFYLRFDSTQPQEVVIDVQVIDEVAVGDQVVIEVRISNTANQAQILDSIDIETSYLEGVRIEAAEPPFQEAFDLPVVDWRSFTFKQRLPAGEETSIQLIGTAEASGTFRGEIDICINEGTICERHTLRTRIR